MMHAPCTAPRFAAVIDRLLVKEPSARKMRRLRSHLAACPACQQRYNKIVLAARLFEGGPEALTLPSEGELARVKVAVLERARLVPDAVRRRTALRWVAALAATGAAVAIALPMVLHEFQRGPSGRRPGAAEPAGGAVETAVSDELQPRGAKDSSKSRVGIRAFCVRPTAAGEPQPQVTSLASAESTCQTDDVLKFAYTNRSPQRHLFLFGLDDQLEPKWYEPHPPGKASIPIRGDVVDEVLGRSVRLAVHHGQGGLRIFGLFSARPITAAEVQAAVARARVAKTPLSKLETLSLPGVAEQRSILIRLRRER